ncbi:MAG: DUF2497 domain-containing protein [Alphaproteobacteria bacterium]|nr:DUF2497 domain-containing protein [Alphaproteobacteria bacterium]
MAEAAENEPSMEEILSSIRRIINEDEDEAPAAEAEPAAEESNSQDDIDSMFDEAPAEEPAPAEASDDVLELTDMVEEADTGTEPMSMDDDLMIIDREEEEEPVAMAEPEPAPMADFGDLEDQVADGIMSDSAATAAMGSFHTLADTIRISEEEGRTLEGVVRALLRPMLKEWLDANLPAIVDEKVQAEIDRVSRRRR